MFKVWPPKNAFSAIFPIRLISWVFCLGIIQYPLGTPKIGLSILNTAATLCAYFCSVVYVFPAIQAGDAIYVQHEIFYSVLFSNVLIHLIDILLMWYQRNRANKVESSGMKIDEALAKLNVPLDYLPIFIYSLKVIIASGIIALAAFIINMIWFNHKFDRITNVIIVIILQHPTNADALNAMNFWITVEIMRWRFKMINKALKFIVDAEMKEQIHFNRNWPPAPMSIMGCEYSQYHILTPQEWVVSVLRIARHLHLELSSLCGEICIVFGLRIAITLGSSIVTITCYIFSFYINQHKAIRGDVEASGQLLLLSLRLVTYCTKIYFINSCCAETTKESRRTGHIIHELHIVSKNNQYRNEIQQFSLQLKQNPLSFTGSGLVILGYEFLHDFVGLVTTHVIISVQVYDSLTH